MDKYVQSVQELLKRGQAYRCFCSSDRLTAMRKQLEKEGLPVKYDRHCLQLAPQEIEQNLRDEVKYTVRMKIPDGEVIKMTDVVRGEVEISTENLDDQIIMKSDGFPTYHLANVVDDYSMQISHVIRGEEWLPSTPKHVLLYRYFDWPLPTFAHLPLLLNPDRSKMSKRQGDVEARAYTSKGYLREALVNYMALLGWNPGDDREIFSMRELIDLFSLERIQPAGAIFDTQKLNWLNEQHLRQKSDEDLYELFKAELERPDLKELVRIQTAADDLVGFAQDLKLRCAENEVPFKAFMIQIISQMRERISFPLDLVTKTRFFFEDPDHYEQTAVRKHWTPDNRQLLSKLSERFESTDDFEPTGLKLIVNQVAQDAAVKAGKLFPLLRVVVSGSTAGPGLFEMMQILGKQAVLRRFENALRRWTEITEQAAKSIPEKG